MFCSIHTLMEDENHGYGRRVSFATEPQINYIYNKESSTTMTNSSSMDITMDITTELTELKNIDLFTNEEAQEDSKSFCKHELSEDEQKRLLNHNVLRKLSLDPLRYVDFENKNNIPEETVHNALSPAKSNLFWRSSMKNEQRKSINEPADDTGMINSSFAVEELVNTIDLKKIIPQEWKEKTSVGEFLASQGIRFLDETVVDGMKRDTLSKTRNTVDPAMLVYYKYSLQERIEFLYSFSGFLIDKMGILQREIDETESNIDVSTVNKDNLKRIRNEARNKAKIDWYSLRKIYEIQFNKKMIENRSTVVGILTDAAKDNMKVTEGIELKCKSIEKLKNEIDNLENKISKFDKENIHKTEQLQQMIEERKKIFDSARIDLETVDNTLESQKKNEEAIQKRIDKLKKEISSLKKNLAIKNVGEHELDELKGFVDQYRIIYHFEMVKASKHNIVFKIWENVVSIEFNGLFDVVSFSIIKSLTDPFSEFARTLISDLSFDKITVFIRKCLKVYYIVHSIKRDIGILKDKTRTECFYLNKCLYVRMHVAESKSCLDVTINSTLDVISDNIIRGNIIDNPSSLIGFALERLNK